MAREEVQREDLIREATALVVRAELVVEGVAEFLVVGFRRRGEASLFVGPDWVMHFDASGHLRRAYESGRIIKVDRRRLMGLTRHRSADEVVLLRQPFDNQEQTRFLQRVTGTLVRLRTASRSGGVQFLRRVPDEAATEERVREWLESFPLPVEVSAVSGLVRPSVGRKRSQP